ncbi:MAG: hypothetical protein QOE58_1325 [Actinomycetota bacterium]|jgi:hypothetical protein|nr:hypothetical protein [Actinomycetota bacterium]
MYWALSGEPVMRCHRAMVDQGARPRDSWEVSRGAGARWGRAQGFCVGRAQRRERSRDLGSGQFVEDRENVLLGFGFGEAESA